MVEALICFLSFRGPVVFFFGEYRGIEKVSVDLIKDWDRNLDNTVGLISSLY